MKDPHTFLMLYGTSYGLGAIDGTIAKILGQESFFGTQLDILMSRFATSSIIFAVLKLGLEAISEEWERMAFAFFFASLFLSDFVSYWFQVYSSYLLDEESHVTPIKSLEGLLWALKLPGISLIMNLLAELFVVDHYLAFFPGHPHQVLLSTHPSYHLFLKLAWAGMALKTFHNVCHLLVSAVRIVKLDVAQKNEEFARAA
jgi:phosphatidylglycerophosphate synthase